MPIAFTCPQCGTQSQVAEQYAGQSGPCAHCGEEITVPPLAPPAGKASSALLVLAILAAGGLCVLAGGVALIVPAVKAARGVALQAQATGNLTAIGMALHGYHAAHGVFPPAYIADANGKPMHSWRVLILPYLNQQAIYQQYDFSEPWDGPNNSRLASLMPPQFAALSVSPGQVASSFALITGPGTLFDADKAPSMAAVTDGTSNTLLVVEVSSSAASNWLEPVDLDYGTMSFAIDDPAGNCIISSQSTGAQVLFADGSVHILRSQTGAEAIRAYITPSGGETLLPP